GSIPGIHEVLRRQGLLEGSWCLDADETLSPGQQGGDRTGDAGLPSFNRRRVCPAESPPLVILKREGLDGNRRLGWPVDTGGRWAVPAMYAQSSLAWIHPVGRWRFRLVSRDSGALYGDSEVAAGRGSDILHLLAGVPGGVLAAERDDGDLCPDVFGIDP